MKSILYFSVFVIVGIITLQTVCIPQANAQGWKQGLESVSSAKTGLPETDAKSVIVNIVRWLLSLVFWLAVLAFVASGLIFIVSFGNASIHSIAKDWLMFAIIGLVVSVLGYVIIVSVSNMLTGKRTGSFGGSGSGGTIIIDENGVWGEATMSGENGGVIVNNEGVFGDIRLPW